MANGGLKRRTFSSTLALLATAAALPALRAQPRLEVTRIAIAVGAKAAFFNLPLTIAQQLGYFSAEGLEVEISSFAGESSLLHAVAGGSVEVVSGAYGHTISLQSKGQRFQSIVLQGRAPAIAMGVSLRALPHYKTAAELKGRKIGISAVGSASHMVANLILSRAGLNAGDVSFIGIGSAAGALTALRSGQIDAVCSADPVMTTLEQKGELRIIADTRTLKGTLAVFGGPMPGACLYAGVDFVKKNPNTVQALTNAMVRSLKWLQTAGPSDIIKTVPETYLLGDRALYLAAFNKVREAISPDGLVPEEGPRTALKVLAGFDSSIKVEKIELAKTYSNEFAKKAKARFMA